MKAILISIKPRFVADILNGKKTLEIRKTCPQMWKWFYTDGRPLREPEPIYVYIYCTNTKPLIAKDVYSLNGKVVAKFTLNKVEEIKYHFGYYDMGEWTESYILENACLSANELDKYLQASKEYDEKKISRVYGYAWHIDNLVIFDKPKELSEFYGTKKYFVGCGNAIDKTPRYEQLHHAPQSWCYIRDVL